MSDLPNYSDPPASPALSTSDLETFNEYLLQISRAGMPMEHGLALLSKELRSSRLKGAIDGLVADLQAGTPIEQAIGRHRQGFPPLYGQLIDVGIRTSNLPGVLARFGRHMETMAALRDSLWRACAYPAVVFFALLVLLTLLSYGLLPNYFRLINATSMRVFDFRTQERIYFSASVPWIAIGVYYLGLAAPFLLAAAILVGGGAGIAFAMLRASGRDREWVDRLILRLPIVGRAVRDSYVASWLDVLAIGTESGLDLLRSLTLAADAIALPSLTADSASLASQLEHGQPTASAPLRRVPAMIPMAIDLAQSTGRLPRTLTALAEQFQQQAERQIRLIPGRVMPIMLIVVGILAAMIMYSLWMPLARVLQTLTMS